MGGLELKVMDKQYDAADIRSLVARAGGDEDMVKHFEELLGSWCLEIERYLGGSDNSDSNGRAGNNGTISGNSGGNGGPLSELEKP